MSENNGFNIEDVAASVVVKTVGYAIARVLGPLQRIRFKFFPTTFNVMLAVDYDKGTDTEVYYQEISKNLKNLIGEHRLDGHINIKDVSGVQSFSSKNDAEAFRNKRQEIDLIIWGRFSNNVLKQKGKHLSELGIHFTFGHPRDTQGRLGAIMKLYFESSLAQKNYWTVFEENSFDDLKILSDNMFDTASYILGIIFKLYGLFDKSSEILERLLLKLEKQDPLVNQIKAQLINNYQLMMFDAMWNGRKYNRAMEFCERILKIDSNNHWALSNLAFFQYKMSLVSEAALTVEKITVLYPDRAITIIDNGFFYILNKRYTKAYECFRKVLKNKEAAKQFDALTTIETLGVEFDKTKEPALLYASGVIGYFFTENSQLAINDLNQFLKLADENKYKYMYKHALRILSK